MNDHRARFDEEGYLVVENVFPEAAIAAVRAEYAALLDGLCARWVAEGRLRPEVMALDFEGRLRASYVAGLDWFQPMDISLPGGEIAADTPMHFGPAIFSLMRHDAILDLVEGLIGPEITSNPIQHVRIKPPAALLKTDETRPHVTYTDWHQDRGVTHAEADETEMVTVWIAISDATAENGCLQVVPRTHREALKTHCPAGIQLSIPDAALEKGGAVPLPVKSGGVVIFHPGTAHASLVNRTDGFRWSFDIRYNVTGQPTGRNHFPSFVARSRAAPQTELRDADQWRALWEAARARLARRPHIPIHRWDADAPACA
ncbi:phytanoyl-CoA dioxygenase family protein [Pikeienuella piscinae]|uniref:Phytanoyl-CoA dioxygenase family protein n=1 Tax=Pikeienuella piscinae TaxID=2748098 RepID=A0A7L5BTN8_9RHOB|nr:phytanoyl-CoA dioxygenase family protein [Pikeienuella piscinae]QIE55470.1 phytanoyl-CoA dioxygenase family protein [Pikeienuella piscinae]